MATDAIGFLNEMELAEVDVPGFSIGNFVARELMLIRSAAVAAWWPCCRRRDGAAGMHGWAPDVIEGVPSPDAWLTAFCPRPRA